MVGVEPLVPRETVGTRFFQRDHGGTHHRPVVLRRDLHRRVRAAVVAPPISSGMVEALALHLAATCTISSSDGVISRTGR
jgi:mRNA-degrading endonuclease toxin of MazEF toxin-antitoxin module